VPDHRAASTRAVITGGVGYCVDEDGGSSQTGISRFGITTGSQRVSLQETAECRRQKSMEGVGGVVSG